MIILRQKSYSEEEKNSGLKKAAKIIGGTALLGATAFGAAKTGMLGSKAQIGANKVWGNMGAKINNLGGNMMTNAAKGISSAQKSIASTAIKTPLALN